MWTSALATRACNGSQGEVIGEMDFLICVGPHEFTITFQVMDIHLAYSFLLRRSWVHATDAVTSILHQKLKFMFWDKLVIVCGEEDFVISELSSSPYVEIEEGITKVPFQCLDF